MTREINWQLVRELKRFDDRRETWVEYAMSWVRYLWWKMRGRG